MAKALTQVVSNAITNKRIDTKFTFTINSIDKSSYLRDWDVSHDKKFGSASATFTLDNSDGRFNAGEVDAIEVGDIIQFIQNVGTDTSNWKSFYGKVEQRSIDKTAISRTMTLVCLDYISILQKWDIDLVCEGNKLEVIEEILTPVFLSSPNDMFSQVFNFANEAIADQPAPIFTFKDKNHLTEDPQYDGFDVLYSLGQVKLGAPLNARDNYDFVAKSYWFYTEGLYAEDILELILTQPDGYGNYLFGEPSASELIRLHLQTTYQDEEGDGTLNTLTPNLTTSSITIKHEVTTVITANATSLNLDSIAGLPSSGEASISGDIFTWTGIDGNTLTGIPSSGSYALKAHAVGSKLKYTASYPAGQVWYLKYSNIVTDLTEDNFTIPGSSFAYLDKRNGRIILTSAIATSSLVRCEYNYCFKTLQSSDVELNKITFRSREVENRYEAINKLRNYLAPNYIIRTQGDNKIWASFLSQSTTADYTLNLIQNITYLEDEDLFTRVVFYGKNINPTNLMFSDNVSYATTGQSYKAIATQTELAFSKQEDGWNIFKTIISDAGYITTDTLVPIVYINGVPVDDKSHQMIMQPVKIEATNRTETKTTSSKFGGSKTETQTWTFYKIYFASQNLIPSESILLYDMFGTNIMTISPNDSNMDYGRGVYDVPGDQVNSTIESLSTATYWVGYSTSSVEIDYDTATFKINSIILPEPAKALVSATFEYFTVFTSQRETAAIIDGRWDTQCQTEFFSEPPSGYAYAILDMGSIVPIQAIDISAGFYRPDEYRKFDIDMRITLHYSLDGVNYYEIGDAAHSFQLTGGSSHSLEESDLGLGFSTRYIKVILENVKKIDFSAESITVTDANRQRLIDEGYIEESDANGTVVALREGIWAVAFTEIAVYSNIVLKSEATLIPTTALTVDVNPGDTVINVSSTENFINPNSGSVVTAYLGSASFTYTGLTPTSFIGCTLLSGATGVIGDRVSASLESDTTVYDDDGLRLQLGDRLYKEVKVSDEILYNQSELDTLAKAYLEEFLKNHSKLKIDVLYAPYLKVGQTVELTDAFNNVSAVNYFIESISMRGSSYSLVLARYPA